MRRLKILFLLLELFVSSMGFGRDNNNVSNNMDNKKANQALITAACTGNVKKIIIALNAGANVNATDESGETALHAYVTIIFYEYLMRNNTLCCLRGLASAGDPYFYNGLWMGDDGSSPCHGPILRSKYVKKIPLADIKKFAGILSLYYSKCRLDQRGEVYFSKHP